MSPASVPSGLAGWIGETDGDAAERILARMVEGLAPSQRRAADAGRPAAQRHTDAGAGLAARAGLGQADLAVGDDLWAAIEGEPRWTDAGLVRMAAERGHAKTLCEAYRRRGPMLFGDLAGGFSLALVEPAARRALIAIDRFGINTLCYARTGDGLVFGGTTQAVRAHPSVDDTITPQDIYNYLRFYVSPAPKTIYQAQRKLLPAQYLRYEDGRIETGFYWRVPYREDARAREAELAEELDRLLEQAVRRCADGEDPDRVGAFLSGGLDSSTVVGMLERISAARPRTFTVSFDQDGYDESHYARIAARHFDADYHDYALTAPDARDLVPEIAAFYDEPFGNSSAIPAFYCAHLAREHDVDLLLGGDGGDEIFGGNERYVEQRVYEVYQSVPARARESLVEPLIAGMAFARAAPPVRKAQNYIARANMPLPDRLLAHSYWHGLTPGEIFEPGFVDTIDPDQPLALRREVFERTGSGALVHRMMHLDLTAALADNDLRKVKGMAALAGVRVRFPFLDEELVEFAAQVPPGLLIQRGRLRAFFKRAMTGFLPEEILLKSKHGFGMPFEEWLKTDVHLRALTQDALMALKTRGIFRPAFLDDLASGHAAPARAGGDEILWDLVTLELWLSAHRH